MSYYKRKRRTSEKHEVQLSLEQRQQIQNLFEKKFSYRKPVDGSWCLSKHVCSTETEEEKLHHHGCSQSQASNKSCASVINQSGSLVNSQSQSQTSNGACASDINLSESSEKSGDQFETSFNVLKELWTEEKYIGMKNELNELKNNLNDKNLISWHNHTRSVNLAGGISAEIQREFRPELCTQAWCKFYEIATTYLHLEEKEFLFSVHLCEAPGAFVTSLNHYMLSTEYQGGWDWIATTLNPYYEGNDNGHMIGDDRLIRHTRDNWYFGVDDTGNLMSQGNLEGLKKLIGNRQVDLVTADGSIDCQGDPAEQENVVSRLQHCEALTALQILSPGGDFVLKMFTLLECKAVGLMYLLNCVFEEVNLFKPCTSKGGNSEVYVVCQKFKGVNNPQYLKAVSDIYFADGEPEGCLFRRTEIPASFLSQHTECNSFFKELQMTSIQRNLDLYRDLSEGEIQHLEAERQFCVECFLQRYKVVPMVQQWRVIKYKKKKQQKLVTTNQLSGLEMQGHSRENEGRFCGSFDDRLLESALPWKQKVKQYKTYSVADQEFEVWIEYPHAQTVFSDFEKVELAYGKPVSKLASSRFCYGKLIQQTQEIRHNVKWLSTESSALNEIQKKKFLRILASYNDHKEELIESNEQEEKLSAVSLCPDAAQRYDVCYTLDEQFELNEQQQLVGAVRNIIQTCQRGRSVIIEMRSCLTRMTASLVYLLYKAFHKIGFLSYHGDLMKQCLLCLNYTGSPDRPDCLENFSTTKTEAGFGLLEIVPISHILDDSEFCSFLQLANTRLLQSFITTVIERERNLLLDNTGIT